MHVTIAKTAQLIYPSFRPRPVLLPLEGQDVAPIPAQLGRPSSQDDTIDREAPTASRRGSTAPPGSNKQETDRLALAIQVVQDERTRTLWAGSSDTQAPHTPATHTQSRPLDRHHTGAIHFNSLGQFQGRQAVGVAVYCWQACLSRRLSTKASEPPASGTKNASGPLRPTQHRGQKKTNIFYALCRRSTSPLAADLQSRPVNHDTGSSHTSGLRKFEGACVFSSLLAKVKGNCKKIYSREA